MFFVWGFNIYNNITKSTLFKNIIKTGCFIIAIIMLYICVYLLFNQRNFESVFDDGFVIDSL